MLKIIKNSILFFLVSLACLLTIFNINNAKMSIKAYDDGLYFDQLSRASDDKKEKVLSLTQHLITKDNVKKLSSTVKEALNLFLTKVFQGTFGIQIWDSDDPNFSKFANFACDKDLPGEYYKTILPNEIQTYYTTKIIKLIDSEADTTYSDEITKVITSDYISGQVQKAIVDLTN
ncbi:hypothetical protein OC683_01350 ['Crotalaria aegyptiaca' phytoplasma]|uniref:Effector n=1 Tax=Candidatus Phytoplasma crotalariae TaxID=2982627 RepID=A0ABT9D2K9_9MOLU|nr:hypothetical protein ['Crotalaria aegyptiaca' phytoplasma]MDO8059257.1 hypothetical protein ['Crotalaria aegyptiaca' phytoplasma]